MNTRQTGNVYEQMAADYLEKQGMRILERNFRRGNEEDIFKEMRCFESVLLKYGVQVYRPWTLENCNQVLPVMWDL